MNLMDKYRAKLEERQGGIDDLLQTPRANLKKPLLIESGYLKDTFYLVANETQAREVEQAGGIAYLPQEIRALLTRSGGMDKEALKDYLNKVHMVKRVFPGAHTEGVRP